MVRGCRFLNAYKFQNEVAAIKIDLLLQDRLSDTELDRVAGGMDPGVARPDQCRCVGKVLCRWVVTTR